MGSLGGNSDEKLLKIEIMRKISQYYRISRHKEKFASGETLIHYAGRVYDEKELKNLVDASLEFWLTAGRYASEFEDKFSKFLGLKYCLLTNSGSSANLLAVSALTSRELGDRRLKPKDEVITTACGFPTTVNPIIQNNAVPVFVDIELGTYNIDSKQLERAITRKTRAIFIAHTLGNPANMGRILKIAKKYNLWLIEDICDSLGSRFNGKYTGTFGHISTCSFYPAHHITMGEGGAVLTNDKLLHNLALSFRDWGRDCYCKTGQDDTCGKRFKQQFGGLPFGYDHKYVYSHLGYNLKITDLQAAIGCAQLEKLPSFIALRKENFSYLYRHLEKFGEYLLLPRATENSCPSWFGFPILVKNSSPIDRDKVVAYLEGNKIATRMLFGGNLTKQPAYQGVKYRISGSLKNTDVVMNNLFWIGVYPGIKKPQLDFIVRIFEKMFI